MFTRFRTASAAYVSDLPLIKLTNNDPGASFMAALGGAYECEVEHLRVKLLRFAIDLDVGLELPDLKTRPHAQAFYMGLKSVIEFLQASEENSVSLYSYERAPTVAELLEAFAEGGGADDWALEELVKKGDKGRKSLLSILKKEKDKRRIFSAISMLLLVFHDDQTIASVQKVIDKYDAEVGKEASLLMAAYMSAYYRVHPRN